MQGIEVGIDEILNCREKRVVIQNEMIRKYRKPIISFTMNIPGPIKRSYETEKIKNITVAIEESSELGRLFDIDVIDINFEKLSRKSFRKCLICEAQAQECGRSRKHSVGELQNKVEEILKKSLAIFL